jgi:hypothetical protein
MARQLYRVYVDETGDRGWGGRSSPIFVTSAVIVRDGHDRDLLEALDGINAALKKPAGTVLHWTENVKGHSQRKYVVRQLAALDMTITSVIVFKSPSGSGAGVRDPALMYNYAVRRLLERVSWFVDDAGGIASVTFAHLRNFPYPRLRQYIAYLQLQRTEIRWAAFTGTPKIDQPSRIRPLQVADLAAGAHGSALRPDRYGAYEAGYLLELAPRIYVRGNANVMSYGFNIVGSPSHVKTYPWWPDFEAAIRASQAKRGAGPA